MQSSSIPITSHNSILLSLGLSLSGHSTIVPVVQYIPVLSPVHQATLPSAFLGLPLEFPSLQPPASHTIQKFHHTKPSTHYFSPKENQSSQPHCCQQHPPLFPTKSTTQIHHFFFLPLFKFQPSWPPRGVLLRIQSTLHCLVQSFLLFAPQNPTFTAQFCSKSAVHASVSVQKMQA
jgi:hypothetical protein